MTNRRSRKRQQRQSSQQAVRDDSGILPVVAPQTDNAQAAERDDTVVLPVVAPTDVAPSAERDNTVALPVVAPTDVAPSGERDDTVALAINDVNGEFGERNYETVNPVVAEDDGQQADRDSSSSELDVSAKFEDRRQKTVPQTHDELESHIAASSARRVAQSAHQPLASYTPPCTRSMAVQHARDVISPGVLKNELGYQFMFKGKYPNADQEKKWAESQKLAATFEELEKKKKEEAKKKKKEKEEAKKKREAKKKEKSMATKKKSTSKDKKKKKGGKAKRTASRKSFAKKGYQK